MSPIPRGKSSADMNSERKLRLRMDILIALMIVQLIISIGIWVNKSDSEPDKKIVESTEVIGQAVTEPEIDDTKHELKSSVPAQADSEVQAESVEETALLDETPVVEWSKIRIDVLNGCGVRGIAAQAQTWLKRNGYRIRLAENADRHDYKKSLIQDRSGNMAAARELALVLNIDQSQIIELDGSPSPFVDLTVVIGEDYKRLPIGN
ncbi:MAG: LytR C-terminal domain-containing protein [Calditrichaeota bacterium]|mgnify:CR=1 FL=1|nr:LytR C-terminal domain-containing protein [Calditrichota bacterium]MBT7788637.1 LytR C-terminal domain-containing protein [Calditrichota bacterium]